MHRSCDFIAIFSVGKAKRYEKSTYRSSGLSRCNLKPWDQPKPLNTGPWFSVLCPRQWVSLLGSCWPGSKQEIPFVKLVPRSLTGTFLNTCVVPPSTFWQSTMSL
jgi:hypothetical protein